MLTLLAGSEGDFRDQLVGVLLGEGVDLILHRRELGPLPRVEVECDRTLARGDRDVDPALGGEGDARLRRRSLEGFVLSLELQDQFHKLLSGRSGGSGRSLSVELGHF